MGRALPGVLLAATAAALTLCPAEDAGAVGTPLTLAEIDQVIARAIHFARRANVDPVTIAVVDVEGNSLGVFHMTGSAGGRSVALAKAGTASYFSSDEGSFTTRTAAFIIQDHFPPGLRFQPAGPLYGVEFSNFGGSDVNPIYFPIPNPAVDYPNEPLDADLFPEGVQARVRGELGAVALFKGGRRVGALGIDDGRDNRVTVPTANIAVQGTEYRITHGNLERGRRLERVAVAAARPFLPPGHLRANTITLGGFRIPFAKGGNLSPGGPIAAAPAIPADGDYDPDYPQRDPTVLPSRFVPFAVNPPGTNAVNGSRPAAFPIIAGTDGFLTAAEVEDILWRGAVAADRTRAAIRRPIGLPMQCWVSVVDTNGEVLGVFRTQDATLFSYDVSVQKARTAVLFSDANAAWSTRAVGLFAQAFYPAGQQQSGRRGPLYQLQDGIAIARATGSFGPAPDGRLRNGITVFPGGVPLYRNGVLVGGVGVSGDGVDQDDLVADAASAAFTAPGGIRCDFFSEGRIRASLGRALDRIDLATPAGPLPDPDENTALDYFRSLLLTCRNRLANGTFDVPPSYVKLPRHPGPVTVR